MTDLPLKEANAPTETHAMGNKSPDPFNPESLRLSQGFTASAGVKRLLTTVPVRKPGRQDFIRVHPDEGYRLQTTVIDLKEDREVYLVAPALHQELADEVAPVALFTGITRQGVLFLWPVKLPREDGRWNAWNRSALDAADHATKCWVRVAANMQLGAYEIFEATGNLPEPDWPDLELKEILRLAFRDHFIDSGEHPVVQRLRGAS